MSVEGTVFVTRSGFHFLEEIASAGIVIFHMQFLTINFNNI